MQNSNGYKYRLILVNWELSNFLTSFSDSDQIISYNLLTNSTIFSRIGLKIRLFLVQGKQEWSNSCTQQPPYDMYMYNTYSSCSFENNSKCFLLVSGSIGEIVYGRADIAFNGVFIKHYHSEDIQFTTPVHFDQVCFVVPKALTKPKWKTVFLTFDLSIWISVWFSYWIVLVVWFVIRRTKEAHFDKLLLSVNLYRIFLMMPINRIRSTLSERIIVLSSVLFAFVVASSFQGSMIKFLTYETYEQDMSQIAELAESNLPIMTASLNLKELFETDENPIMSKLLTKFLWRENNSDILGQISQKRNAAAIGRKSDMEEKIAASYVKNNQILLHIVEECPRSYHIAYLVPKMSPYIAVFNDVINYFIEAGITNSWFIHAKPFRSLTDYHTSLKQTQVVFTFENVRIAFMILVSGLVLSCFVFVGEVVRAYFERFSLSGTNNLNQ